MKAMVGSSSRLNIFIRLSGEMTMVQSAAASALPTLFGTVLPSMTTTPCPSKSNFRIEPKPEFSPITLARPAVISEINSALMGLLQAALRPVARRR